MISNMKKIFNLDYKNKFWLNIDLYYLHTYTYQIIRVTGNFVMNFESQTPRSDKVHIT